MCRGRHRLYSASYNTKTPFFNGPLVGDGSWLVMITQDRPPAGAYNKTLPAGVAVVWGSYVIDQCPVGRDPYICEQSILTPHNPREKVRLKLYFHLSGIRSILLFLWCSTTYILQRCANRTSFFFSPSIRPFTTDPYTTFLVDFL